MDPREREAKQKKEQERQALLDRAYDRVIGSQLDKLSKKKETTGMIKYIELNITYCVAYTCNSFCFVLFCFIVRWSALEFCFALLLTHLIKKT
jgi:hypothetical protein